MKSTQTEDFDLKIQMKLIKGTVKRKKHLEADAATHFKKLKFVKYSHDMKVPPQIQGAAHHQSIHCHDTACCIFRCAIFSCSHSNG